MDNKNFRIAQCLVCADIIFHNETLEDMKKESEEFHNKFHEAYEGENIPEEDQQLCMVCGPCFEKITLHHERKLLEVRLKRQINFL